MEANSFFEHLVQEFTKNLGRELTEKEKEFLLWLAQSHIDNEE